MKNERLLNIIGEIDDKYIEEAAPAQKQNRKNTWIKWTAVAAGVIVAATAVVIPLVNRNTAVLPDDSTVQSNNGTLKPDTDNTDRYKDFISENVSADRLPWDWEDLTLSEKFGELTFENREYSVVNRDEEVGEEWLEKPIGECKAYYVVSGGYDYYGKSGYKETLTVYKIKGIDERFMVAAGNDEERYVYRNTENTPPDTLGELFEIYDLPSLAELDCFTEYEGEVMWDYYLMEQISPETVIGRYDMKDGDEIWRILSECTDAKLGNFNPDKKTLDSEHCVRFTVLSEPLGTGAYRQDILITDDGYFLTDIFGGYFYNSYIYDIGEDAAQQIISFAKSNCEAVEKKPFSNCRYVLGKIIEIGDGYVVIDDTIACKNPEDGTTFKVLTNKTVISRELKGITKTGGLLYFEYRYKADENNVIDSATSVHFASIKDGIIGIAYC